MPTGKKLRRQSIHDAFATLPGTDGELVSARAVTLWEHIAREFEPLIGAGSVNLIFARCVELNKSAFPWLRPVMQPHLAIGLFADLKADLLQQTPTEAVDACRALLTTFAELLDALIGEHLTSLFLRPVLECSAPSDAPRRIDS